MDLVPIKFTMESREFFRLFSLLFVICVFLLLTDCTDFDATILKAGFLKSQNCLGVDDAWISVVHYLHLDIKEIGYQDCYF